VRVRGSFTNRLAPGRYVVKVWILANHSQADQVLHAPHILDFVVFGSQEVPGLVGLAGEASATRVESGSDVL
jgi:hypothetical protein